jgi:uncharacterized membrane-anchored protein YhcB (DUF1043 family)
MNEFLKMDIFFAIAAIGFVVLTVMVGIVLWYAIRLVRTLSRVADTVEGEANALKNDFDEARASIKREGMNLMSLFGFARKTSKRLLAKKRRST